MSCVIKIIFLFAVTSLVVGCTGSDRNRERLDLDLSHIARSEIRTVASINPSNVTVTVSINDQQVGRWQMSSGRNTITLPFDTYRDRDNTLLITWVEAIGGNDFLLERYNGTFTVSASNEAVTPTGNHLTSDDTGDFDFDGDGVSNLAEIQGGTDPAVNLDAIENSDVSPAAPVLNLQYIATKKHRLSWSQVATATFYRLLENTTGQSGFEQVGSDLEAGRTQVDHIVALHKRSTAQYMVQACNTNSCTSSNTVSVSGDQRDAIGYFKASNTRAFDQFGKAVVLSEDGNTMVVGAPTREIVAGAVYVFFFNGTDWIQQAYLEETSGLTSDFGRYLALSGDGHTLATSFLDEQGLMSSVSVYLRNNDTWKLDEILQASNPDTEDFFGFAEGNPLSLSFDGAVLAIGAAGEQSNSTGENGNQEDNSSIRSGAAYVFERFGTQWVQTTYLKASNSQAELGFGSSVSLSNDGTRMAVGASGSYSTGVTARAYLYHKRGSSWEENAILSSPVKSVDQLVVLSGDGNHLAVGSRNFDTGGRVHLYSDIGSLWEPVQVLESPTRTADDDFGVSVSINNDGGWLVIGQVLEGSSAVGVGGDSNAPAAATAGAAHVYRKAGNQWLYSSYLKASNTNAGDRFGQSVGMSGNGDVIAVGADGEGSSATGISSNQSDNSATGAGSGAVYLY